MAAAQPLPSRPPLRFGLDPAALTPAMERFASEVVPRVRAAVERGTSEEGRR